MFTMPQRLQIMFQLLKQSATVVFTFLYKINQYSNSRLVIIHSLFPPSVHTQIITLSPDKPFTSLNLLNALVKRPIACKLA